MKFKAKAKIKMKQKISDKKNLRKGKVSLMWEITDIGG